MKILIVRGHLVARLPHLEIDKELVVLWVLAVERRVLHVSDQALFDLGLAVIEHGRVLRLDLEFRHIRDCHVFVHVNLPR